MREKLEGRLPVKATPTELKLEQPGTKLVQLSVVEEFDPLTFSHSPAMSCQSARLGWGGGVITQGISCWEATQGNFGSSGDAQGKLVGTGRKLCTRKPGL